MLFLQLVGWLLALTAWMRVCKILELCLYLTPSTINSNDAKACNLWAHLWKAIFGNIKIAGLVETDK